MRRSIFSLVLLTATVSACASEPEVVPAQAIRPPPKHRSGSARAAPRVGGDEAMAIKMSVGYLDERAVDSAIEPHERAMAACFARAGKARTYLSGQIVMRFVVAASGEVSDVQVIRNDLGSYPVENCLVLQGKQIVFPVPEGRSATDFEYSMSFTSTGERLVVPWSAREMAPYLYAISTELADCGQLAPSDVDVVAYVEPGGAIGSVGFASQSTLDPTAAVCAVALMSRIRINDAHTAHSGVVLRATFPMALAFEPPLADSHKLKHARRH